MTVEKRLERLERQNRRLRWAVIGVVAVGLSLLVTVQTLPPKLHDVVRAKKFEVVSNKGKVKVIISSFREAGQISVLGEIYPAVEISADSLGHGFIRTSNKLENSVLIESTIGGHGKISTYSIDGKELVVIGETNNGEGRIVQFNRAGKPKTAWPSR